MNFSFLYQICFLALIKLTNSDSYKEELNLDSLADSGSNALVSGIESLIAVKVAYMESIEASLTELALLKVNLSAKLKDAKITNTAGNIASIAGTVLMFTPFFFAGMAVVGAGTAAR